MNVPRASRAGFRASLSWMPISFGHHAAESIGPEGLGVEGMITQVVEQNHYSAGAGGGLIT